MQIMKQFYVWFWHMFGNRLLPMSCGDKMGNLTLDKLLIIVSTKRCWWEIGEIGKLTLTHL